MTNILVFSKNLEIFEKRAENEYLHPNGTSEVSHNWKLPKIRIFALNSRCASWVPKAVLGHFWDFFQKSNDLKKIFAKMFFLDFGHPVPYFKPKNAKNANFRLKMAIGRNFCGRKFRLWGRGGRKKFGPHQKYPKVFSKKIPWWPHFEGSHAQKGEKQWF